MAPDLVQATGPCSVIEYEDFDPGSTKQIVKQLRGFWRPTEFTPKGSPKVNESNLQTITDDAPDAAKLLGEFKILTNRVIMLKTWLNALGEGDRIHGSIISCGANTHRASHYGPNTANIPASISKRGTPNLYGAECRRLWAVSGEDRVLVGVDAASIQLRILAHLRNNTAFTSHIESGDAHQYHADLTGYSRIVMKTFIYAWLLGCGNARAGFILGGSPKDGKELIETFLARNPDLVALKAKALDWARQGYYVCSDGRRISIKEPHYALAVALQGEEQAIMKRSIVTWYGQKKQEKLDSHLVGWIHDETQLDTLSDNAGRSGEIMVESIRNAGVFFKYNCKLDGGVKIGKSWADTH
jgi:DNA polymerase-1